MLKLVIKFNKNNIKISYFIIGGIISILDQIIYIFNIIFFRENFK